MIDHAAIQRAANEAIRSKPCKKCGTKSKTLYRRTTTGLYVVRCNACKYNGRWRKTGRDAFIEWNIRHRARKHEPKKPKPRPKPKLRKLKFAELRHGEVFFLQDVKGAAFVIQASGMVTTASKDNKYSRSSDRFDPSWDVWVELAE